MAHTVNTLNKTDDVAVRVGMEKGKREAVSRKLSGLLASTYFLYHKALFYHWNVTGPNFVGLHALFERQYEELHKAGDELAERVRALGHFTPGTVHEFLGLSAVKDESKLPGSPQRMVKNLLAAHEQCCQEAREVLEVAEKAEDEVTVDIMVARMTAHDKSAWMLRSILE